MPPLPPARSFLKRLNDALDRDAVALSEDARDCAFSQFGWEIDEIFAFLYILYEDDFHETMPSTAPEGGAIWVFLPMTEEGRLWIRLCERGGIVVVSLHRG